MSGQRYWIFFTDKGSSAAARPALSEFALEKKQRKNIDVNDPSDKPVSEAYIRILEKAGVVIYRHSRWLNAVSGIFSDSSPSEVEKLPFVSHVQPVHQYRLKKDLYSGIESLPKIASIDYGASDNQVRMIGIPTLHEMNFSGQGVRIALFDTGFRLTHESLQHIEVIDSYDFINDDHNVDNEAGDHPNQFHHGTRILSVIGGYKPGILIGPAFRSEYLLAKTEDVGSETHLEEDNWVAAAEWADSLGADIISSSLGYSVFDTGESDYTYEDMNGNTAIITRAANIAVEKGIAVFTSAGNEGTNSWYHITAPADGFNVISVGGLNPDGLLWNPSSRGPTYDGRIKPEVVAQAGSVFNVDPNSVTNYSVASGTSLSCPLAAGSGALILSINPNISPVELRELMIKSASQYQNPDNDLGYGRVDLVTALNLLSGHPQVEVSEFSVNLLEGRNLITWKVHLEIENGFWSLQRKYGQGVREEIARIEGNRFNLHTQDYEFLDTDIRGGESIHYILAAQPGGIELKDIDSVSVTSLNPKQNDLLRCYPNPFNSQTAVIISLIRPLTVSVSIFDVFGRRVKTLVKDKKLDSGYHHYVWQGTNDHDIPVSSGTYFIVALKGEEQKAQKVILLK